MLIYEQNKHLIDLILFIDVDINKFFNIKPTYYFAGLHPLISSISYFMTWDNKESVFLHFMPDWRDFPGLPPHPLSAGFEGSSVWHLFTWSWVANAFACHGFVFRNVCSVLFIHLNNVDMFYYITQSPQCLWGYSSWMVWCIIISAPSKPLCHHIAPQQIRKLAQ